MSAGTSRPDLLDPQLISMSPREAWQEWFREMHIRHTISREQIIEKVEEPDYEVWDF